MSLHPFPRTTLIVSAVACALVTPLPAAAAEHRGLAADFRVDAPASSDAAAVFAGLTWEQSPTGPASVADDQTKPRVIPFEYSDGYRARARIHKLASVAMLPLVATEAILGQSLYNNPSSGKRNAHLAVATAIGGLFGVNTVTGVWNLVEARKDSHDRTRRTLHGILMLAADAGFLATAATGPGGDDRFERERGDGEGSRSTHRAIAFTSFGLATAGYLLMLFGGH